MSAVKGDDVQFGTEVPPAPDSGVPAASAGPPSRTRTWTAIAAVAIVLVAAVFTIYHERHSFADTLHRVGVGTMLASSPVHASRSVPVRPALNLPSEWRCSKWPNSWPSTAPSSASLRTRSQIGSRAASLEVWEVAGDAAMSYSRTITSASG